MRDHFLGAGIGVRPSDDVRSMLAQVQATLPESLRLSPDFRPARKLFRWMVKTLTSSDRAAARALLGAMPAELSTDSSSHTTSSGRG